MQNLKRMIRFLIRQILGLFGISKYTGYFYYHVTEGGNSFAYFMNKNIGSQTLRY